jgi:hypothetical protein
MRKETAGGKTLRFPPASLFRVFGVFRWLILSFSSSGGDGMWNGETVQEGVACRRGGGGRDGKRQRWLRTSGNGTLPIPIFPCKVGGYLVAFLERHSQNG